MCRVWKLRVAKRFSISTPEEAKKGPRPRSWGPDCAWHRLRRKVTYNRSGIRRPCGRPALAVPWKWIWWWILPRKKDEVSNPLTSSLLARLAKQPETSARFHQELCTVYLPSPWSSRYCVVHDPKKGYTHELWRRDLSSGSRLSASLGIWAAIVINPMWAPLTLNDNKIIKRNPVGPASLLFQSESKQTAKIWRSN